MRRTSFGSIWGLSPSDSARKLPIASLDRLELEHATDRPATIPAGPAAGLPNSRRLRPGQLYALKQLLLTELHQELFAPGSAGEQLWEHGLVSRLDADASCTARTAGLWR